MQKKLTGRIASDRIKMQSTPTLLPGAVERFMAFDHCAGIISDAMYELQIPSQVFGASVLRPSVLGLCRYWSSARRRQSPSSSSAKQSMAELRCEGSFHRRVATLLCSRRRLTAEASEENQDTWRTRGCCDCS
jgi:hypothetical protein